jgi:hypothetical protein
MALSQIPAWFTTVLLNKVYQTHSILLFYKVFKFCIRILTGTTEILRVCRTPQRQETDSATTPDGDSSGHRQATWFWDVETEKNKKALHLGHWELKGHRKTMQVDPGIVYRVGGFDIVSSWVTALG